MLELTERLIDQSLRMGASYAGIMYHEVSSSMITAENGAIKSYVTGKTSGLGVRVLVDGALAIASSTTLDLETLNRRVEYAVKMAKAARLKVAPINLKDVTVTQASVRSPRSKKPTSMSDKEKIALTLDANKSAMLEGVKNSVTRLAWINERRSLRSSEGTDVTSELNMTGLAQSSVSRVQGQMESVSDSQSRCAGFEFIVETDWCQFARDVSETSLEAVRSRVPKAGVYNIVADPELVGLLLHEAFGHASEADLVMTRESVLEGRLGEEVASPRVTIVDDGLAEGGYFLPYDDEGVAKRRQMVVENGTLVGLLHSRETAYKMDSLPTGNARAESFGDKPIVRQTNFFMAAGDHSVEELVEDIDDGLYICGRGTRGGQVDVGHGTFTFRAGPSYVIKKGEVGQMVRGVSLSGMVLTTLKNVDAVGNTVEITTSIFGGCGKQGQRMRVGDGGPHVRIGGVVVGGGS